MASSLDMEIATNLGVYVVTDAKNLGAVYLGEYRCVFQGKR